MKTTNTTTVHFHIGRGGKFHNQGHKTYCGQKDMSELINQSELYPGYEYEIKIVAEFKDYSENNECKYHEGNLIDAITEKNEDKINDILSFINLSLTDLGDFGFNDLNGKFIIEENAEVGILDFDGDYDTDIIKYISECSEEELRMIVESRETWTDAYSYAEEKLGI